MTPIKLSPTRRNERDRIRLAFGLELIADFDRTWPTGVTRIRDGVCRRPRADSRSARVDGQHCTGNALRFIAEQKLGGIRNVVERRRLHHFHGAQHPPIMSRCKATVLSTSPSDHFMSDSVAF
jgi:hypothetical protein